MTEEEYRIKYLKEIDMKPTHVALDWIEQVMFMIDMSDRWDEEDRKAYVALLKIQKELKEKLEAKK